MAESIVVDFVMKDASGLKSVDGNWYNPDKKKNPSFSGLKKGDVIEADLNGKWVQSFKVVGTQPVQPNASAQKTQHDPNSKDISIARAVALKAAVDSRIIVTDAGDAAFSHSYDQFKELTFQFEKYLTTGAF